MSKQTKTVPKFPTEGQERAFWEKNDSADHQNWAKAKRVVLPNLKPTRKKHFATRQCRMTTEVLHGERK